MIQLHSKVFCYLNMDPMLTAITPEEETRVECRQLRSTLFQPDQRQIIGQCILINIDPILIEQSQIDPGLL